MKRKLLKSLLAIAVLCAGSGSAWADEHILYSQNFESFATDANFNTVPGYWQKSGASVQKIVESGSNKYLTYQTTNGSTRNAAINFNISSFTANDNWTVSFDASLAPGNNDAGMFLGIVGANGSATGGNAWDASTGNLFSVKNAARSSTSYEVTVGGYTLDDALTLTSGSYYHYILNWDGSKINLTITKDGEDTPALSTSKDYSSENNTTLGAPKAIFWVTTRYYGTTNIDNVIVSEEITEEVVSSPIISSAYAGANRTVTITDGTSTGGNDVTTYYTLDGTDPTSSSSVYSGPLDISSDCTVKAISISTTDASSAVTSLDVTVGKLTLVSPTISKTDYSAGNYTVTMLSNQSGLAYVPASPVIKYSIDGGAAQTYSSAVQVPEGSTVTAHVEAENYTNSTNAVLATGVMPLFAEVWSTDFTALSEAEVTYTEATFGSTFYELNNVNANFGVVASESNNRFYIHNGGLYVFYGGNRQFAINNLEEGDYIRITSSIATTAGSNVTLQNDLSYGNVNIYKATSDGIGVFNTQRYNVIYKVEVLKETTEVDLAILDCKRYETSAAFATAVAAESFSTAAEVYAFHTAWQIAQAKAAGSVDITKVIRNAAIADGTDWGGSNVNYNQQFTGAPDNTYLDIYNKDMNTNQTIYGVPAGTYKIKAATRAAEGTPGTLYINDGSSDIAKISQITNVGNTGGDLDNGWSYQEMTFTLTEPKNLLIGFWTNAASGKWAGCDDWHMEIAGITGTIPTSGIGSLASAYGLNFAGATVSDDELKAYVVTEITADRAKVTPVDEMPANSGVILEGTPGATYSIPVKADATFAGTNKLKAAVTATPIAADEAYILKDGEFHKVTAASTVPAGKAYLLATDVPAGVKALRFDFDGLSTGVDGLANSQQPMANGPIFNLAGQRVNKAVKGLYIVNSKKIIK